MRRHICSNYGWTVNDYDLISIDAAETITCHVICSTRMPESRV